MKLTNLTLAASVLSITAAILAAPQEVQVSAMTFPTYVTSPQTATRVLWDHIGGKYYFDRIWVKGQNYGYTFKLPKNVVARSGEQ
jgi:hypothetical protein